MLPGAVKLLEFPGWGNRMIGSNALYQQIPSPRDTKRPFSIFPEQQVAVPEKRGEGWGGFCPRAFRAQDVCQIISAALSCASLSARNSWKCSTFQLSTRTVSPVFPPSFLRISCG